MQLPDSTPASWETVHWKSLKVGDVIKLSDGDFIPADLVILSGDKKDGVCYIETANLDGIRFFRFYNLGETNYKMRQALGCTNDLIKYDSSVSRLRGEFQRELIFFKRLFLQKILMEIFITLMDRWNLPKEMNQFGSHYL
jgi:magnesium-transporting ATPase (P-type)